MLQAIRDKAQGWIAWAIVILISIPFALFGIQEYLGVDADPVVAEVDGTEIKSSQLDQRVREFRETLRAQLGALYRPDLIDEKTLRRQVLDAMIDEAVLREAAADWNLRVADARVAAYIRSLPALQRDGRFDLRLYEAEVRSRGMTKAGFEALVRQELVRAQMERGLAGTALVPEGLLDELVRLEDQRRKVRWMRVPASGFLDAVEIDEARARAHYERTREDYRVPERVRLEWVRLDVRDLADEIPFDEAAVREYFETHRGEFVAEQERRVRHILIPVRDGKHEEARALATRLVDSLREGADFAELARRHSADPGSAADGGDLGWVNRGVMARPFEDAVYAARKGEITGPVKTEFGYHIIQVTDLRGGEEADFDSVRDKVEAAWRRARAEDLYYDRLERLADLAYESPDSLEPAAETLGLEIRRSDWVDRSSFPPELAVPKAVNAAFSDEVLGEGNNSDVIELGPASAVVLRVAEHEEAHVPPFEAVRERVVEAARRAAAAERARAAGEAALEKLRAGATPESVAGSNGWKLEQVEIGRDDAGKVPAELVARAFALGRPEGGPRFGGVVSADGDYLLLVLDEVIDGRPEALDEAARERRRAALRATLGREALEGTIRALRERADIEIRLD